MNIYLGNIKFQDVEKKLGYKLTDSDKILFDTYQSDDTEMKDIENGFHIYYLPKCIFVKGEEAKNALLKIFTPDKIIKSLGNIIVYEQE